jgi:hypothetical protein
MSLPGESSGDKRESMTDNQKKDLGKVVYPMVMWTQLYPNPKGNFFRFPRAQDLEDRGFIPETMELVIEEPAESLLPLLMMVNMRQGDSRRIDVYLSLMSTKENIDDIELVELRRAEITDETLSRALGIETVPGLMSGQEAEVEDEGQYSEKEDEIIELIKTKMKELMLLASDCSPNQAEYFKRLIQDAT